MKELESLLLRIAKPKGNRAGGRFAKAENLNRRMKQLIREQRKPELDEVMGTGQRRPKVRQLIKALDDGGSRPVLAAYPNRPKVLPSLAAAAAYGRPTANGWWLWTWQRAPGEWVRLGELRR
jgi:hypothetical protein